MGGRDPSALLDLLGIADLVLFLTDGAAVFTAVSAKFRLDLRLTFLTTHNIEIISQLPVVIHPRSS